MAKVKSILSKQPILKGDYFDTHEGRMYFIDLDTGEKLGFMGLPHELDYNPETSWAVIKPFGRNTPLYHYTGAEDTLLIELSWWAEAEDKMDVIARCKWLESMSKSDGSLNRPHYIRLLWGGLYSKSTWIVSSARYILTDFDRTRGHRPSHARQTVVLKRVMENNRTTEEINDWRT